MKTKSLTRPLRQPGDSAKLEAAADWAEKHRLEIYRTTDLCYQIEGFNFWPDRGTIQSASNGPCKERHIAGLARLLKLPFPD